jgi:hypothetical protein
MKLFETASSRAEPHSKVKVKVKVKVILRQTVGRPLCPDIRPPEQSYFTTDCQSVTPSWCQANKDKVTLRPTVSQSLRPGVRPTKTKLPCDRRSVGHSVLVSSLHQDSATNFSFTSLEIILTLQYFQYGVSPLTRRWVCNLWLRTLSSDKATIS